MRIVAALLLAGCGGTYGAEWRSEIEDLPLVANSDLAPAPETPVAAGDYGFCYLAFSRPGRRVETWVRRGDAAGSCLKKPGTIATLTLLLVEGDTEEHVVKLEWLPGT